MITWFKEKSKPGFAIIIFIFFKAVCCPFAKASAVIHAAPPFELSASITPRKTHEVNGLCVLRGSCPQEERPAVVRTACENAVGAGDRTVYFIPGPDLFDVFSGNDGTVDNCHPNDFSFWCMAKGLYPLLRSLK